jgi:hypothetical protein
MSSAYNFNNNVFINPSVEGDVAEYHLDVEYGAYNLFIGVRFEAATPKVRWGALSGFNRIIGGYRTDLVVFTKVAGQVGNVTDFPDRWEFQGTSVNPSTRFAAGSAGNDALAVYAPNDINGIKRWGWNESTWRGRGSTSTYDILSFESATGKLNFGSGAAPADRYISVLGSYMGMAGTWVYATDNTQDFGAPGFRPRYVRAGTGVQTGAFATASRPSAATAGQGCIIIDTTLHKQIHSDGAQWYDAMGNVV